MKTNEVYDVDGCKDFIPVIIDGIFDDGVAVTVIDEKRDYKLVVEEVYRFPKVHEPQKVVVPKFVAEWIDTLDEHGLFGLNYDVVDESVQNWVYENYDYNAKKLHLAYLYGYTVEKEKLYTVEIPDPHGIYKIRYLFRNSVGNIRIGGGDYRDIFLNVETHLTEAEIKKDFEWAWQWAKEVE